MGRCFVVIMALEISKEYAAIRRQSYCLEVTVCRRIDCLTVGASSLQTAQYPIQVSYKSSILDFSPMNLGNLVIYTVYE